MSRASSSSLSLLLLLLLAHCRRAAKLGYGVALRYPNTSCPAGTFFDGGSDTPNCCPDGQFLWPDLAGNYSRVGYCCPTPADCLSSLKRNLQCADSSWTYYPWPSDFAVNVLQFGFCCLPGWTAYEGWRQLPYPSYYYLQCAPANNFSDEVVVETIASANPSSTGIIVSGTQYPVSTPVPTTTTGIDLTTSTTIPTGSTSANAAAGSTSEGRIDVIAGSAVAGVAVCFLAGVAFCCRHKLRAHVDRYLARRQLSNTKTGDCKP